MNQQSLTKKNKFVSRNLVKGDFSVKLQELLSISHKLCSLESVDEVIKESINSFGRFFNSDRSFFAAIFSDEWVIQAEDSNGNNKTIVGLSGQIHYKSNLVKNFLNDGYLISQDLFSIHKELNFASSAYFPIFLKGQICGVLSFVHLDQQGWSNEEVKLMIIASKLISQLITQIQSIEDLKSNNEKLLELDQGKSQLMSTISHELRTPLTNIIGFSELLLRQKLPEDLSQQYIHEINNSANRLSNLIYDFLDLSRAEATGQIQLGSFEEIEIDWLAEGAWSELASQNKDHQIKWKISQELPTIYADPDSIKRVFINIFSNAIKYSDKNTEIDCSIVVKQSYIIVSIKDQGMGIPQDMLSRVFDPFFRVDNSYTRKIGGTGLGLAICKEIINAHNGEIWCNSEYKKGSEFIFRLPINLREDNTSDAQIWLN